MNRWKNLSLRGKLGVMSGMLMVPLTLIIVFLLLYANTIANAYEGIVQNIVEANEYNVVFKDEMDAVMYQMVARSLNKEEVEAELGMSNPDELIQNAKDSFQAIKSKSDSKEAKSRIRSILNLLSTLQDCVNDMNDTVKVSGHYDENMEHLDTDIRIITELIQERISEYIYYESLSMEETKERIDAWRGMVVQISCSVILIIIGITIASAIKISRSITQPIDDLCRAAELVGSGKFETRTHSIQGNELAILSSSFNSMTEQIGELVENIKEERDNSRNLELRLLQSQINPHFLYNTLDNIVWLAEDDRKEDVASIVTSLSQFFRTTLSGGRDIIRISEEMKHIEAYLEIQAFRYADRMTYEIIQEPFAENYGIIKMTLQPIVENALYHGIKNKRGKGCIQIGMQEWKDRILLWVADDGIGMTPEELDHIQHLIDGKEQAKENNEGFGMANVAERLRLNYGEDFGIQVQSQRGKGTRVEISIPKLKMERMENFQLSS